MPKMDQKVLDEALVALLDRENLMAYRENHRIKSVALTDKEVANFQQTLRAGEELIPLAGKSFKKLTDLLWQEMLSEGERGIRSEGADHFQFRQKATELVGLKEFILVSEGYTPPRCGVILFFENQTSHIEAVIQEDGELEFILKALVPENIYQTIRFAVIAAYHDLVVRPEPCPFRERGDAQEEDTAETTSEQGVEEISQNARDQLERNGQPVKKREHTRPLPEGHRASVWAIANALRKDEPKYRHLKIGGPETFVRESVGGNPEKVGKLLGSASKLVDLCFDAILEGKLHA